MFSDDSARVGTSDTFYGYGTVGTVGTVRWVRWVRYGGYGTVGTVGTVRWVRWVRWVRYGACRYAPTVPYPPYPPYRTHRTSRTVPYPPYRTQRTHRTPRTVPTVPPVPYHRTQRTAPFTVPSFLRTVPPHRALLLKFDKVLLVFYQILSTKMEVSISMSVSGKVIWLGKRPSDHDHLLTKSCTDEGDRSTKWKTRDQEHQYAG